MNKIEKKLQSISNERKKDKREKEETKKKEKEKERLKEKSVCVRIDLCE